MNGCMQREALVLTSAETRKMLLQGLQLSAYQARALQRMGSLAAISCATVQDIIDCTGLPPSVCVTAPQSLASCPMSLAR